MGKRKRERNQRQAYGPAAQARPEAVEPATEAARHEPPVSDNPSRATSKQQKRFGHN